LTVEQKIQVATILSKANQHAIPCSLEMFNMKPRQPQQPTAKPIDSNVSEFLSKAGDIHGKISRMVYEAYRHYCKENGIEPISHVHFSRQVCGLLGLKTTHKRTGRQVNRVYENK